MQVFQFHGSGKEYFKIWLANLSLSILTLGIYSAWATVRTRRYFYGNTEYQSHRFDYLANPIAILKGRIIAVALLALYMVVNQFHPLLSLILALVLLFATPWIMVRSLRFHRRMTQYRNVRFDFVGGVAEAAKVYVLWPILGVISFGMLMPMAYQRATRYTTNHSRFGNLAFDNTTPTEAFYAVFFKVIGLFILLTMIAAAILFGIAQLLGLSFEALLQSKEVLLYTLLPILYILFPLVIGAYRKAAYSNIIYSHTRLDQQHQFAANFRMRELFWLYVKYGALTLCTLGLAWPWMKVALARYASTHTQLTLASSLDHVVDTVSAQIGAAGEELGEAFDLDIGAI